MGLIRDFSLAHFVAVLQQFGIIFTAQALAEHNKSANLALAAVHDAPRIPPTVGCWYGMA
jgi:hypothetical protein